MHAASLTLNKATPVLQLKPPKPISLSTSKFKFVSGKTIFRGNTSCWGLNTMAKFTETRVCIGRTGDGIVSNESTFEQEAFIDDSSGLPSRYAVGRLNTTMNRLSKWLMTAVFGSLVVVRGDAEGSWLAMGCILNVLLSTSLKQMLKQERPASASSSGPGMPSSHAQSIFFAVMVTNMSMVEWLGLNSSTTILSGLLLALASYLSWLRVSLNYHTSSQVGVGAMVGSMFSIFWFWAWNTFVFKSFHSFLSVRIMVTFGAVCLCGGFLLHVFQKRSQKHTIICCTIRLYNNNVV